MTTTRSLSFSLVLLAADADSSPTAAQPRPAVSAAPTCASGSAPPRLGGFRRRDDGRLEVAVAGQLTAAAAASAAAMRSHVRSHAAAQLGPLLRPETDLHFVTVLRADDEPAALPAVPSVASSSSPMATEMQPPPASQKTNSRSPPPQPHPPQQPPLDAPHARATAVLGACSSATAEPCQPAAAAAAAAAAEHVGSVDSQPALEWIFYAELPLALLQQHAALQVVAETEIASLAYTARLAPRLARLAQSFAPLATMLQRSAKSSLPLPPPATPLEELLDYRVLEPCYYVFDKPGKGIRSDAVKSLASVFSIHPDDLRSLVRDIDRYHNLSLMIDDIQDGSTLRRDCECAHLRYGIPWTLNSAYMHLFQLIDDTPRLFRYHHEETIRRVIKGCVAAHRGQGLEIYWRDNGICPTEDEYLEMVRGKTSTPFVLLADLFFLHSTDWRLRLERLCHQSSRYLARALDYLWGPGTGDKFILPTTPDSIIRLFDLMGIYFQIRDDYINLVDPQYWKKKGFVDDIHERKFSFPIIYLIRRRRGRYEELLRMYKRTDELLHEDLVEALKIVQETDALQYTYDYLLDLDGKLRRLASTFFPPLHKLLDMLKVNKPDLTACCP